MRTFLLRMMLLMYVLPVAAGNSTCKSAPPVGYKVVKNTLFPFSVDGEKACFFAFYMTNPKPVVYPNGNGNPGDTLWYGYYELRNPNKIIEFPKPQDTRWCRICRVDAVSFGDMNGDKKPDVTIIGSCDYNTMHQTFPLIFIRRGGQYILDEDMYKNLHGAIELTVADVRGYLKSPFSVSYHKALEKKYKKTY